MISRDATVEPSKLKSERKRWVKIVKTNLETLESQAIPSSSGRAPLWTTSELEGERRELTPRQLEILSLIAKGRSNKEIGFALGIRERTVKFHVAALFERLGTSSRTEALVVALRLGVVHLGDDGKSDLSLGR